MRGLAVLVLCALLAAPAAADAATVPSIELEGTVDPASERWLDAALDDAERAGAPFAIVRLDTPGGLDTSMRGMVKRITESRLPVVVHVAPSGARAASAGLYILQAADVAAMAPQTNTGSATPVQIGGDEDEVMGRKVRNDAAAYVRALADGHRRNGDLAARMVDDAVNVPAPRAADEGLIDVLAGDEQALLRELDGYQLRGPKDATLTTAGVDVERRTMPWNYAVLQLLVNPTVASLLMLAGLAGLAIELFSPGGIVPGVVGAIALVLGMYGTAQLPVSAAGVVLLLLALALIAAETQVPSGGALGVGGVVALVAGLLLLYDTDSEVFRVSVPAAIAAGAVLGGLVLFAAKKGVAARHRPVHGGREALVGMRGEVRTALDPEGQVWVDGALWRAVAQEPGELPPGSAVEVGSVDGLTLTVHPAHNGGGKNPDEGDTT